MTDPGKARPSAVCELVDTAVGPPNAGAGDAPSIEGIDWVVKPGDYWVLAGWPGSGKSDLLGTIAGFQPPLTGRCVVLGKDLYRIDQAGLVDLRLKIGFVFGEGGRLFNELTLAENIALPLAYHTNRGLEEVIPEVQELLTLTGLDLFAARLPSQVGRVWRQRAAIARALVMKPELLLLANPIAGFDARQIPWWCQFLSRLNAGHPLLGNRSLTIILAAEDLRPWAEHAGQFAVIGDRALRTCRSHEELAARETSLREWIEGVEVGSQSARPEHRT